MGSLLNPHLHINRGLVLNSMMWEGAGTTVEDLSGNGNTGAFQGTAPSWSAGKFGSAVLLPGTDEYIVVANNTSLNSAARTVVAWFKTSSQTADMGIVEKYDWNDPNTYGSLLRFDQSEDDVFFDINCDATGVGGETIVRTVTHIDNEVWYQVVGTWDGTADAGAVKIYLNGVFEASGQQATAWSTAQNNSLRIGCKGDDDGELGLLPFDGQIDHATIWNRALSASEIALIYREPFCGFRWTNIVQLASYVATGGGSPMLQMNHFNGGMAA